MCSFESGIYHQMWVPGLRSGQGAAGCRGVDRAQICKLGGINVRDGPEDYLIQ